MRISILPKSSLGRWSVGLAAAIILLFVLLFVLAVLSGLEVGLVPLVDLILDDAFGTSGIGALVTGLISLIKSKERSILVSLVVVAGLFALIVLLDYIDFVQS